MKKLAMMMWMVTMLAIGAGACLDEETAPRPADGAPLSAEQRAALEANPELRALRAHLAADGSRVALDEARLFEQGDKRGIICPVRGQDGQPGPFSQLAIEQRGGGEPRLSLEPAVPGAPAAPIGQQSPLAGPRRDEARAAAGIECEAWFPGAVVGSYCDWATACWFGNATYNVQDHVRTCCARGVGCWEEHKNIAVRARCGC